MLVINYNVISEEKVKREHQNMLKKIIYLFILGLKNLVIVSICLFIYIFLVFLLEKNTNLSTFKISLLLILLGSITYIGIYYLFSINRNSLIPNIYKAIALGEFLFIFSVFGPVFIDRSISYHMIMAAYDEKSISTSDFEKISDGIYVKRLDELVNLGLLHNNNDRYYPTNVGQYFAIFNKFIGQITGTDAEYKKMIDKLQLMNKSNEK